MRAEESCRRVSSILNEVRGLNWENTALSVQQHYSFFSSQHLTSCVADTRGVGGPVGATRLRAVAQSPPSGKSTSQSSLPTTVDPGSASTPAQSGKPPSDAVVLFQRKKISRIEVRKRRAPKWKIIDGSMEVVKGAETSSLARPSRLSIARGVAVPVPCAR